MSKRGLPRITKAIPRKALHLAQASYLNSRAFHSSSLLKLDQSASSIFDILSKVKRLPPNSKSEDRANWDLYDLSLRPLLKSLIDTQKAKKGGSDLNVDTFEKILQHGIKIKNESDVMELRKLETEATQFTEGDIRLLYKYCILAYTLSQRLDYGINDVIALLDICVKYGAPEAEFILSSIQYQGIQGIANKEKGFSTMRRLADEGLLVAIASYGTMLHNKGDAKAAIEYFKKGAKCGNAQSCLMLGREYHLGKNIQKDLNEASRLYNAAIEKGSREAYFYLGLMEQERETPDFKLVVSCFEKAASVGFAEAQYNLGLLYFLGKNGDKNYNLAMEYWEMASNQKFPLAMMNLAKLHLGKVCSKSHPSKGVALLHAIITFFKGQEFEKHAYAVLTEYENKLREATPETSKKDKCNIL